MFETELKNLFQEEGVGGDATEKLFAVSQPGLHLQKQLSAETIEVPQKKLFGLFNQPARKKRVGLKAELGASRLGGLPDVPPGFVWPRIKDKPMQFLAQINCAEIPAGVLDAPFPAEGLLYFFFDFDTLNFFRPHKNNTIDCVKYSAFTMGLSPAPIPDASLPEKFILPAFPVKLLPIPTFPDGDSPVFEDLDLSEEQWEGFYEAQGRWQKEVLNANQPAYDDLHQVGGIPIGIQGDIQVSAEVLALRQHDEKKSDLWQAAQKNAADWCLLLQLDSDGDMGTMWGDGGRLYFCLRKADLAAKKFERNCIVFECH